MRIKKIELLGFKSFKDRTVIQFDAGITGIVGPNGCGKSNIVDALVWVMGEMSAKDLRGSAMTDVIFAGAEGYAPMGMAEVSLVLENDGGPFPVQYLKNSEIMVTRRLHRDGESEYLINKESARLRDVQEIFMDTGAGAKGFSIIQQGMIGRIITAKPEDRRMLIEEAAGITKFKARKRESQRKMQATDQNLVRLQDIVGELKRQLDSLDRQAQKARKYRELKTQIEELDLWLTSKQYAEQRWALQECQIQYEQLQAQKESNLTRTVQMEAEQEAIKVQALELEKELDRYQSQQIQVQLTAQQKELEVQELKFEIEQARRDEQMTQSLLQEQGAREELLNRDLEVLKQQWQILDQEARQLQRDYEEKNSTFEETQSQRDEVDEDLTESRRKLFALGQSLSSLEGRLHGLESQRDSLQERHLQEVLLQEELQKKKEEFRIRYEQQLEIQNQHLQRVQEKDQDLRALESEKKTIEGEYQQKKLDFEFYKEKFTETSSRLMGLEDLHRNFEGYQEGVKNLLLWQKNRQNNNRQNLSALSISVPDAMSETSISADSMFQPLSEFVEVPSEYEVALEATLGERLQMLMASDSHQALEALEYLKESKSGRSSFYLSDHHSDLHLDQHLDHGDDVASLDTALRQEEGFHSFLSDVAMVQQKYAPILGYLFQKVCLVDKLTTALRLRSKYSGWTFVTLDGETLSGEGILTGGATQGGTDSGVLRRRRQIKELREQKEEWEGKMALVQQVLEKLEIQLREVAKSCQDSFSQKQAMDVRAAEIRKDVERSHTESENATYAMDRQNRELQKIKEQVVALDIKWDELHRAIEELRGQRDEMDSHVQGLQEEMENMDLGFSQLQTEVMNLQLQSVTKSEQFQGVQKQKEMLEKSLSEIQAQRDRMKEQRLRSSTIWSENQMKLEQKKLELERDLLSLSDLKAKVSHYQNEFELIQEELRKKIDATVIGQKEKNEIWMQINECQLRFEQVQLKAKYFVEQIREKYMQNLDEVYEQHLQRGGEALTAEQELKDLRDRVSRMGEVNLTAIEDFDETSKRYEFLVQQQKDLLEAKDQLRRVIDRINRIVSLRFKDTFERVNERFQKVFPVLFGGGEAHLELVEDPEKGEMGIDIIARPPGKKMQNISLLSGGEKALTAVSLVFSIFLVKPSPYCLLDEVDAPLDDANVYRFNDLVREMSKRSQIIVVTHNKHTMEVVGRLYGVTMQEKGISTMVSVNLQEHNSNENNAAAV